MDTSPPQTSRRIRRTWPIVVGIVLFALLMALRYELSSVWARAAVGGGAFVILFFALLVSGRPRT
jgi:hypothetical protein